MDEILITHRASDVPPQKIEWLVERVLPLKALSLIFGEPGVGKSQVSLSIAAAVSCGSLMPLGADKAAKGSVYHLNLEDDFGTIISPRLEAAGADCSCI